jgi:predicted glycoside hydrolase/deacetylase ChbG (UPF0249 family)
MSASRLIVNADDFGYAEAIDRGIVEAFDRGIVTSASIMATGEAFEHAAALARGRPELDIGVHLALTEHRPLTAAALGSGLVSSDGRLPPSVAALASRLLAGRVSAATLRAELRAQIERVRSAGLAVSHLDGHRHVHALPRVASIVADLAAEYGIAAVRYPAERLRSYMLSDLARFPRLAGQLGLRLAAAMSPLRALRGADEFVGFFLGGRLDEAALLALLAALPGGRTVELMCHPGDAEMLGTERWRYAWSRERDALVSPRVRAALEARGIELASYRNLAG